MRERDTSEKPTPYLSICAIYRDEARYLREWIEFHRLVGVEQFFLYDNLSIDNHREVLAPYVADGTVVLHDWPISYRPQRPAYEHCLRVHGDDSRWIAFLDVDEFLFSPDGASVPDVLRNYERWPAVVVHVAMFGTSGHKRPPDGLVLENYVHRMDVTREGLPVFRGRWWVKCIVDPKRTAGGHGAGAHGFQYTEGTAVDENEQPVERPFSDSISYSRLRINHYYTKSEEEYAGRRKGKPRADIGEVREFRLETRLRMLDRELNQERNEAILAYVPALRRALEERDLDRAT
jgi:hypothetical protein